MTTIVASISTAAPRGSAATCTHARAGFRRADVERSLIAFWYDATALFNITRDLGNPYRGPVGLEVNTQMLPSSETPVRLRIIPMPAEPG